MAVLREIIRRQAAKGDKNPPLDVTDDQAPEPTGAAPEQQAVALAPADVLFASQHTRAVVKAMKPRIASNLALITATPVNTVPPVIAGTGTVGQTLRVTSVGTWIGGGSLRYKWQRDTVDIAGATANTYVLVAADSTHSVRAVVTSTNQYGPTSANSNAIAVT